MKRYTRATDWSPFENLASLGDEITRFVDASTRMMSSEVSNLWGPPVDVVCTPAEVRVLVDLPGIKREDIRLSCLENELIVTGQRPKPILSDDEVYQRSERRTGSFRRNISLPPDVDKESIKATLREGVLTVTLARAMHGSAVDIEIEE